MGTLALDGTKFARLPDIGIDLSDKRIDTLEFPFRSKILDEPKFDVFAIDVAIKIEEMNFQDTLVFFSAYGRSIAQIDHAMV